MKSDFRLFCLFAGVMFLGACSSLNPFSASRPEPAPLADIKSDIKTEKVWSFNVGSAGKYVFQPVAIGDVVFAAAANGEIVRLENGRAVWRVRADKKLSAGVGSDGRLVVVVAEDGTLIAIDAITGDERWNTALEQEVLSPPSVSTDIVVVRTSDHRLIAVDPEDGARRWMYQRNNPSLGLRSHTGVLVEGGAVLAGFPGGKLVALEASKGTTVWELTVALPRGATELERITDVTGTPVLGQREICAVAFQGRAACFDLTNGNSLWTRDISSSVGMDRDARLAVITDAADAVVALDANNGSSAWKQDGLGHRLVSRPLLVADYVVVGDYAGYLHVLSSSDGDFISRARIGGAVRSDIIHFGDGFVVQSVNGEVAAFEIR